MRSRILRAAVFLSIAFGPGSPVHADDILGAIDLRPILARHAAGNSLGLGYNPDLDVLYVTHGSDFGGSFVYTIDLDGNVLHEFDFNSAYGQPAIPTSIQYDRATGHLFIEVNVVSETVNLVEMSPDGSQIFSQVTIPNLGGTLVRDDGIWQSGFQRKVIQHYSRQGQFIGEVSVSGTFPGLSTGDGTFSFGPLAIASSLAGNFFVADVFGRRLVEVDTAGRQLAAASLAGLGRGNAFGVSSDPDGRRIFLSISNETIYVLAESFLRPVVNELVTLESLVDGCSRRRRRSRTPRAEPPQPCSIRATFRNTSGSRIGAPVFIITELSQDGLQVGMANAGPSGQGEPGFIGDVIAADVGDDGLLEPGESLTTEFVINILTRNRFRFFVDLVGDPLP